jgi:hypothetical protein
MRNVQKKKPKLASNLNSGIKGANDLKKVRNSSRLNRKKSAKVSKHISSNVVSNYDNLFIKMAGISNVVIMFLFFPYLALSILKNHIVTDLQVVIYFIVNIVYFIFSSIAFYGFIRLGYKFKVSLLSNTVLLIAVSMGITLVYDFVTLFSPVFYSKVVLIIISVVQGILLLIYGLMLLKLRRYFKGVAIVAGVLNIISAVFFLSYFWSILFIFLFIPTIVAETMLLFLAAKTDPSVY